MKNRIFLSPYNNQYIFGLYFLAYVANQEALSLKKDGLSSVNYTMTGICLVMCSSILMVVLSRLLSSSALIDFFMAVLILSALALSGVCVVDDTPVSRTRKEGNHRSLNEGSRKSSVEKK